jgi:GR25 family glycosyltransferase involved in LPS biosynthesis
MSFPPNILYINLDHREDRLWHVVSQFNKLGWTSFERFPAVKTKNGAVGCGISHIKCLELALSRDWDMVTIIEDDFKCIDMETFKKSVSKFQENHMKDGIAWDVLLLGGNVCPPYTKPSKVDYCIQVANCQTTIGYVVKKAFYKTLIDNMREAVALLMRDIENKREFAIDMYWKRLQGSGRWYIITPLTITQHTCFSDVEEQETNYDHLMLDLEKSWLFSPQYQQHVMQNMTTIKKKSMYDGV